MRDSTRERIWEIAKTAVMEGVEFTDWMMNCSNEYVAAQQERGKRAKEEATKFWTKTRTTL
jgi:hypothetical protein